MSAAYHPQVDRQTKKTHRTLEWILRCLLSDGGLDESQWYTLLPQVEFFLNCQVSSSAEFSPLELVFGQKLVNPIDIVIGTRFQGQTLAQFVVRMQQLFGAAQGDMEYAQKAQKVTYKKNYKVAEF